jgi:hypothetical protein
VSMPLLHHELSAQSKSTINVVFHAYSGKNETMAEEEFFRLMYSLDSECTREDAEVPPHRL